MIPDYRPALAHLGEADPVLADIIRQVGPCLIEPPAEIDLFLSLLRAIVYQQLHGKAAAAIHARVLAHLPEAQTGAATLLALPEETLRAAGLSAAKLRAARDLAARTLDGTVPAAGEAVRLSDEELIARLTAIRGVGPWTVHMLLIFQFGRLDVLPTGDYAVRKAFSLRFRRGRAVTEASLARHARRWRPYRSIASWYLWRSFDITLPEG